MSGAGADNAALFAHLATGTTTVARAWAVTRADGLVLGFTDHDRDIAFDGIAFRASSGMTASALLQTTGLAIDNAVAMGALSDASVTEADIVAGRFDGARVQIWLVNWADVSQRALQFTGHFGQLTRGAGAFHAELRGLTEGLNAPQGQVYQTTCGAVLGDGRCRFDMSQTGYATEVAVEGVTGGRVFRFARLAGFEDRWFERGRLVVLSGAARGLVGIVKNDRLAEDRMVELWQALGAQIVPGDRVRIEAGCDKLAATCRLKFANLSNFRGFPDIPGTDWLTSYPVSSGVNDGGALT
ncbi:MAG: DUF2163 domain-containing protein [Paracoccaceae bacterium]|nr:DUF2163 domain-containing protein [Paracoccaceae bacterium]